MKDLSLALIQSNIHWHDAEKNRAMFSQKIDSIEKEVDLIVLPEMFSTGFSMEAYDQAEKMHGSTISWMRDIALKKSATIAGSIIVEEKGKYYNRLVWMPPHGHFTTYDKRHLFRFAQENRSYTAGKSRMIVKINEWRICLNVCYDLRFPVWTRNQDDYDVLLFVANWPEARRYPWMTLLRARAIENMCYVIGLNRVGYDGLGNYFSGDSAVIHPDGKAIVESTKKEEILYTTLKMEDLNNWKANFEFYKDRDSFEVKV